MKALRGARLTKAALAGLAVVVALWPHSLAACAACFGQSDDAMAKGMNMGIFALLAVVSFVLTGFAAFGIFLARRAARFSVPVAPFAAASTSPAPAPVPASSVDPGPLPKAEPAT